MEENQVMIEEMTDRELLEELVAQERENKKIRKRNFYISMGILAVVVILGSIAFFKVYGLLDSINTSLTQVSTFLDGSGDAINAIGKALEDFDMSAFDKLNGAIEELKPLIEILQKLLG